MAEEKKQTTTSKKSKSKKRIAPEVIEEIKSKIEELNTTVSKLQEKLAELEKLTDKESSGKKHNKTKNEVVTLPISGRKVLVTNLISNTTTTIVPNDSLSMTPNNIYRFQLDKEFTLIKLKSPYDETFELVGFDRNIVKIRPRRNITLKDNEPLFVILA